MFLYRNSSSLPLSPRAHLLMFVHPPFPLSQMNNLNLSSQSDLSIQISVSYNIFVEFVWYFAWWFLTFNTECAYSIFSMKNRNSSAKSCLLSACLPEKRRTQNKKRRRDKNSKKKRDVESERERERLCERGGEIDRERYR